MNAPTSTIGNQIDASLRSSSQSCNISHGKPQTVRDLLGSLSDHEQIRMLRTTVGHICTYLNVPLDQLMIDALDGLAPRFKAYLQGRRYERNTIRSYCNYAGVLLRKAKALGWTPQQQEVPEAWSPMLAHLSKARGLQEIIGIRQIIDDAVRNGKSLSDYADADLDNWESRKLEQGFTRDYVRSCRVRFRRLVFEAGLDREMPHLSPPLCQRKYGVPVEKFPEPLRTEFKDLKRWKMAECAEGRGYKGRHRAITALKFEGWFCRMVGLLAQDGAAVSSLDELFTKQQVQRFVKLATEQLNLSGDSLRTGLGLAFAAVKHYPPLQDESVPGKLNWMQSVISQIRPDPESLKRRSKERKWVKYSILKQMPDIIEAEIAANPKASEWWVAWMRQRQLILKWLTVLPWRQRNLREARLLSCRRGPANIFHEVFSELSPMDLPAWAEAALKANPEERLWQFAFDEDETKSGREVRGVVPGPLVPFLEDFITKHRARLIKGIDPGTLFLDATGGSFSEVSICRLVSNAAVRYVKRRVTPHLFRDIFAAAYLKDTRDYLSLSKVLWHKNPKITIERYGRFFDESAGARVVEEWLQGRRFIEEWREDGKKPMQPHLPNGTLEQQLRKLQVCMREKTAELDDLKGAISVIEANIRETAVPLQTPQRGIQGV